MKLLVCPKDKDIAKEIARGTSSFLLGVKSYTTNQDCCFTVGEIKDIRKKYPSIEIFLLMNKNLYNDEIESLKKTLQTLDTFALQGIFFYDQAILYLHQKLGLKTPLVWNQTHLVTNYNTCNYYQQQGCSYALLAGEITLDEMLTIKKNTSLSLMVTVLGYPVMSHSRRKLLTHYFKYLKKPKTKDRYQIKETMKDTTYFLREDETGTSFYQGKCLNGSRPLFTLKENDFSYGVVFEQSMEEATLDQIIPLFHTILNNDFPKEEDRDKIVKQSVELLESDNTGFFYQSTIYKVKKNE